MRQGRIGASSKVRRRSHGGSTMNDNSNNSDDLFLDDDLNNIFVETDEVDANNNSGVSIRMDDFSNGSIGSSARGRRRRSSGASKASKASISSSSRSLRSRSGLFSANSLDANDDGNKAKNSDPQSSSGVATRNKAKESTKSDGAGVRKNVDAATSNSVNKSNNFNDSGRTDRSDDKPDYDDNDYDTDTDVDDDEVMLNNPTKNDGNETAENKAKSETMQNASSVREISNNKEKRQSPNFFKNENKDALDVIGAVKGPTWHNEAADKEHRKQMILEIARLLQARKKAMPTQEWLHQLPHKARKLEGRLYRTASSLESYLDRSTLKNRLRIIANTITRQYLDNSMPRKSSALSSLKNSNLPSSLSKLLQNSNRQSSSTLEPAGFDTRSSIFSNASTIDTTRSLSKVLNQRTATFAQMEIEEKNSGVAMNLTQQQFGTISKDSQTSNPDLMSLSNANSNHSTSHPSLIVINHSDQESQAVRPPSGSEQLNYSQMFQDRSGIVGVSANNNNMLHALTSGRNSMEAGDSSLLQQQLMQQFQEQNLHPGNPSLHDSQGTGMLDLEMGSSSVLNQFEAQSGLGISSDPSEMPLLSPNHSSKSELERQKAVNAKLQEQIMANIRLQNDLVRRLQSKGQLPPQQGQSDNVSQQGTIRRDSASSASQSINDARTTNTPVIGSSIPASISTVNNQNTIQIGNSPMTSTINSHTSPNLTTQLTMLQNDKKPNANIENMGFNVEQFMMNNATSQMQPMHSNEQDRQIGIGLNNSLQNAGNFNNPHASLPGHSNLSNMNRIMGGNDSIVNNGLSGNVSSLQNNFAGGMLNPLSSLQEMSAQQHNRGSQSTSNQSTSKSSNSSSLNFQNLVAAQQRALSQQISGSNNLFQNETSQQLQLQQQQHQMQLLRDLAIRNALNNNQMNSNSMSSLQAFQQQQQQLLQQQHQQQLLGGMGSLHASNMPPPLPQQMNNNLFLSNSGNIGSMMGMGNSLGGAGMGLMSNNMNTNNMSQLGQGGGVSNDGANLLGMGGISSNPSLGNNDGASQMPHGNFFW